MEDWQKTHIYANLAPLASNTICNNQLIEILQGKQVLQYFDLESLELMKTNQQKSRLLYIILITKPNGYFAISDALSETNQSKARDILVTVPTKWMENLQVEFLGKTSHLTSLLDETEICSIESWLCCNISTMETFNTQSGIVKPDGVMQLLKDTTPAEYPFHVPRRIFRGLLLNPEIFNRNTDDIFVFKPLKRQLLRKFVQLNAIETSTSQLLEKKISARFIILDSETGWERLRTQVQAPIHLIRFDEASSQFVLEATSGGSDTLYRYLEHNNEFQDQLVLEDEDFIGKMLAENWKGVGISGEVGMGKSHLLARIARAVRQRLPERILAFISLKKFTPKLEICPKLCILELISTSPLATQILYQLSKKLETRYEIFFDELDQVEEKQLDLIVNWLSKIHNNMSDIKLYITSRPVQRGRLELIFADVAFDIQPLSETEQQEFLVNLWSQKDTAIISKKLREYAQHCLQNLLEPNELSIFGSPLFCELMANAYTQRAVVYADRSCKTVVKLTNKFPNLLYEICQKFILRQLGEIKCQQSCLFKTYSDKNQNQCSLACRIKSFHVWQGIRLIFPYLASQLTDYVSNFDDLPSYNVLSPGILHKNLKTVANQFQFDYRLFAEFLLAEYFSNSIFSKSEKVFDQNIEQIIFNELLSADDLGIFPDYVLRENRLADYINTKLLSNNKFICNASISSSSSEYFGSFVSCLRFDYEALLKLLMKATKNSDKGILAYHRKFLATHNHIACSILQVAAKNCKVQTFRKLSKFFARVFSLDIIRLSLSAPDNIMPLKYGIHKADMELVVYLMQNISIENHGLLYTCLENTYLDTTGVVEKKLEIAELLLKRNESLLTETSANLLSPLFSPKIHLNAIKFLVKKGVNCRITDDKEQTVLILAAKYMQTNDFLELGKFLVESGDKLFFLAPEKWQSFFSRMDFDDGGYKPDTILNIFHLLFVKNQNFTSEQIANESQCVLKTILKPSFYENYKQGFVALFRLAILQGNTEIADLLISYDSSLLNMKYENHQTPLLLACCQNIEIVEFLVSKGANVFDVDASGETVLHLIAKLGNEQNFCRVVTALGRLMVGKTFTADIRSSETICQLYNCKEQDSLKTPLHYVIEHLNLDAKSLALFVCGGQNLEPVTERNIVVKINEPDLFGKSALVYALETKKPLNLVKQLLEYGANWSIRNVFGCNVTHICAQYDLHEHLAYFVGLGCNVNELDTQGNNALQCTFSYYYEGQHTGNLMETVKVLVNSGANKLNKNLHGMTAHDIASRRRFPFEVLNLL